MLAVLVLCNTCHVLHRRAAGDGRITPTSGQEDWEGVSAAWKQERKGDRTDVALTWPLAFLTVGLEQLTSPICKLRNVVGNTVPSPVHCSAWYLPCIREQMLLRPVGTWLFPGNGLQTRHSVWSLPQGIHSPAQKQM